MFTQPSCFFPVASTALSGVTATMIALIHEMESEAWRPISAQPFLQLTVLTKCPGETQPGLLTVTPAGALHSRMVARTEHTGGEGLGCRPLPSAQVHKGQIYMWEDPGNRAEVRWRAPATHYLYSPLLGQHYPRFWLGRQRGRMNFTSNHIPAQVAQGHGVIGVGKGATLHGGILFICSLRDILRSLTVAEWE